MARGDDAGRRLRQERVKIGPLRPRTVRPKWTFGERVDAEQAKRASWFERRNGIPLYIGAASTPPISRRSRT